MIGGRSYRVAPPPFAVSGSAPRRQARAPPGASNTPQGQRYRPLALANQDPHPTGNYGQESRYVLPYISPRSAQEASRVQLQPDQLRYGERK